MRAFTASSTAFDSSCARRVAVLGFGSFEYHGGVMPYDVDSTIVSKLLQRCLSDQPIGGDCCAYVYPVLPVGYSHEWLKHPGTLSLEPRVFAELIKSIVKSIEYNVKPSGYVFVNGHGGNTSVLHAISKELYFEHGKPFAVVDLWGIARELGLKYCHACTFEAKLYSYLTGVSCSGVDEEFCRDDRVYGQYSDYRSGYCGKRDIDAGEFVAIACRTLTRAIDAIARGELGFDDSRASGSSN